MSQNYKIWIWIFALSCYLFLPLPNFFLSSLVTFDTTLRIIHCLLPYVLRFYYKGCPKINAFIKLLVSYFSPFQFFFLSLVILLIQLLELYTAYFFTFWDSIIKGVPKLTHLLSCWHSIFPPSKFFSMFGHFWSNSSNYTLFIFLRSETFIYIYI